MNVGVMYSLHEVLVSRKSVHVVVTYLLLQWNKNKGYKQNCK